MRLKKSPSEMRSEMMKFIAHQPDAMRVFFIQRENRAAPGGGPVRSAAKASWPRFIHDVEGCFRRAPKLLETCRSHYVPYTRFTRLCAKT